MNIKKTFLSLIIISGVFFSHPISSMGYIKGLFFGKPDPLPKCNCCNKDLGKKTTIVECEECNKKKYCNPNCRNKHWAEGHFKSCNNNKLKGNLSSYSRCDSCKKHIKNTEIKRCEHCEGKSYCDLSCKNNHWKNGHKDNCRKKINIETQTDKKNFVSAKIQTDRKTLTNSEVQTKIQVNKKTSVTVGAQTDVKFIKKYLEALSTTHKNRNIKNKQNIKDVFVIIDFLIFNPEECKKHDIDFFKYLQEIVDSFLKESLENICNKKNVSKKLKKHGKRLVICKNKLKELIKAQTQLKFIDTGTQHVKHTKTVVNSGTQYVQPREEYQNAYARVYMRMKLRKKHNIQDIFIVTDFLGATPEECKKLSIDVLKNLKMVVNCFFSENLKTILYSENVSKEIREQGKKLFFCKNVLEKLTKTKNKEIDKLFEATDYYTNINNLPDNLVDRTLNHISEIKTMVNIRKRIKNNNLKKKNTEEKKKDRLKFIVLQGPNGTGKSSIGKAIAKKLDIDYHCFDCPDVLTEFQGSKAQRLVRKTNAIIDKGKSCVIVFDEIDALMPSPRDYKNLDTAPINKTIGIFVNKVAEKNLDFILVFTTNHPDKLLTTIRDRITAEIKVPFPDKTVRKETIEYYIEKVKKEDILDLGEENYEYTSLNYDSIVKSTKDFSFRQLRDLVYQIEYDCIAEIVEEKNKEEKIVFTNKRFNKFYKTIREKNYPKIPFLKKIDSYYQEYGFIRSIISATTSGLTGGLSNIPGIFISELHNKYFRLPKLREAERLRRILDRNYNKQCKKRFKPKRTGLFFSKIDPEWKKSMDAYEKEYMYYQ